MRLVLSSAAPFDIFKAKSSVHILLKVPPPTFWEPLSSLVPQESSLCPAPLHQAKGVFLSFYPSTSLLHHYFCQVVFVLACYHTVKNNVEKGKNTPPLPSPHCPTTWRHFFFLWISFWPYFPSSSISSFSVSCPNLFLWLQTFANVVSSDWHTPFSKTFPEGC